LRQAVRHAGAEYSRRNLGKTRMGHDPEPPDFAEFYSASVSSPGSASVSPPAYSARVSSS
jgi:hypothetical protein